MTRILRKSSSHKVRTSKKGGGATHEPAILDLLSLDLSKAYPELDRSKKAHSETSLQLQLERFNIEQQIDALQEAKAQVSRQLALLQQFHTANPDDAFVKLLKDSSDKRVMKQTMLSNLKRFYDCWDGNWSVMGDTKRSHVKMHDYISLWLCAYSPDHSKEFIINDLAVFYRGGDVVEAPLYDPSVLAKLNTKEILREHLDLQITKACVAERDRLERKHLHTPPALYLANVATAR